ncbi:hypothetical protein AB0J38_14520 [Streptomyces sp. NPDC050095]|uniref:hypothetical protein n=1 Tax=unclassified Streptomyces TaxID=2593676 RepID=UPI0034496BA1
MPTLTWTELRPEPFAAYETVTPHGLVTIHAEDWNWELTWHRDGESYPARVDCAFPETARDLAEHIAGLDKSAAMSVDVRSLREVSKILGLGHSFDRQHPELHR